MDLREEDLEVLHQLTLIYGFDCYGIWCDDLIRVGLHLLVPLEEEGLPVLALSCRKLGSQLRTQGVLFIPLRGMEAFQ
jgi:hypothetical protein